MPRNSFRPFSLVSAFSAEPVEAEKIMLDQDVSDPIITISPVTPSLTSSLTPSVSTIVISEEPQPEHRCGCSRCMGRPRYVPVSNESIDKKLNWILTLIVFMFILLVVHVRSQNKVI